MTRREQMLAQLQADMDAWPQRVKDSEVKIANGNAYRPKAREVSVLRTPNDPEATFQEMVDIYQQPHEGPTAPGWDRIIEAVGVQLTWEWLMVDPESPYAEELFPAAVRRNVILTMAACG